MNTHIHTKKQKINYIRKFYESQKVVEGFKFSNNFIKQWDNFSILKKSLKDRELVYQKNIKDDIHLPQKKDKEIYYSTGLLNAFTNEDLGLVLTYSWHLFKNGDITDTDHKLTCMKIVSHRLEEVMETGHGNTFNSKPLEDLLEWFHENEWNDKDQELFRDKKLSILAMLHQTELFWSNTEKVFRTLEQAIYSLSVSNPSAAMLGVDLIDFAIRAQKLKSEKIIKLQSEIRINLVDILDTKTEHLNLLKECVFACKDVPKMIEKLFHSVENNDRRAKEHQKIFDIAQNYYQENKDQLSKEEKQVIEEQFSLMRKRILEIWYLLDVILESAELLQSVQEYYSNNKDKLSEEQQKNAEKTLEEMEELVKKINQKRNEALSFLWSLKFN